MHKESTEHERLALKIVTMCMQTLSALKDGELEDYKHIKEDITSCCIGFIEFFAEQLRQVEGMSDEELEQKCEECINRIMVDDRYFIHLLIKGMSIRCERFLKERESE